MAPLQGNFFLKFTHMGADSHQRKLNEKCSLTIIGTYWCMRSTTLRFVAHATMDISFRLCVKRNKGFKVKYLGGTVAFTPNTNTF